MDMQLVLRLTIVCCVLLTRNHGLGVEERSVRTGLDFIHDSGFQINVKRARNVFPWTSLGEERREPGVSLVSFIKDATVGLCKILDNGVLGTWRELTLKPCSRVYNSPGRKLRRSLWRAKGTHSRHCQSEHQPDQHEERWLRAWWIVKKSWWLVYRFVVTVGNRSAERFYFKCSKFLGKNFSIWKYYGDNTDPPALDRLPALHPMRDIRNSCSS